MRILVVTDVTGYMRGGVPAVTRQLIDGLVTRGHTVGFCGDIPLGESAAVQHFPVSFPPSSKLKAEVARAMTAFKPDFTHVMSMSSKGVSALIPVLAQRPWLLTCHSIPPHERKLYGFHGDETLHYLLRNTRYLPNTLAWVWLFRKGGIPQVVVHSAAVAATALAYGQDRASMTTIPLGCDIVGQATRQVDLRSKEAPSIVTTGGIAHTKGYHDAITALASVREEYKGVRYQIIGEVRDAGYLAYLQALIARHGLQSNVLVTPDLPERQKQDALDSADLYLQPSHEEGFCLAYIEAALRVPRLVGTDTGAIRLISENDQGAGVAPVRDPTALAGSIKGMLAKALPAATMQARFRRLESGFSWSGYLDAHESIYQRAIDQHILRR